ncbi:MAG TPA: hypothetical protein PLO67_04695 [Saprospiraceae bacterium]|nr:hypothetical protein [Saprospiraceae bacterium]
MFVRNARPCEHALNDFLDQMNEQGPARQTKTQGKKKKRQHIPEEKPTAEREDFRICFVVPDVHFVANVALFIGKGIGIFDFPFLMPEGLKRNNSRIFYPGFAFSRSEFGFDIRHRALGTQACPEHKDAPEQLF